MEASEGAMIFSGLNDLHFELCRRSQTSGHPARRVLPSRPPCSSLIRFCQHNAASLEPSSATLFRRTWALTLTGLSRDVSWGAVSPSSSSALTPPARCSFLNFHHYLEVQADHHLRRIHGVANMCTRWCGRPWAASAYAQRRSTSHASRSVLPGLYLVLNTGWVTPRKPPATTNDASRESKVSPSHRPSTPNHGFPCMASGLTTYWPHRHR